MPKILEIVQLGNPVLRKVAREVACEEIGSTKIQNLIENMLATCEPVKTVGLAAPQVGESLRIIIIASKPTAAYPTAPKVEPIVMINPIPDAESLTKPWKLEDGREGCASIPGIRAIVRRCKKVKVRYFDELGQLDEIILEGFLARIFQHENDHLNGIVFTDVADPKNFVTETEYQKMMTAKQGQ
jgi:peptide deformylase